MFHEVGWDRLVGAMTDVEKVAPDAGCGLPPEIPRAGWRRSISFELLPPRVLRLK